jgi:hypothetical protein
MFTDIRRSVLSPSSDMKSTPSEEKGAQILYYFKYNTHIFEFFPVEKLRCVLNSRNVHLADFFNPHSKTGRVLKLRVSYIRRNMGYARTGDENKNQCMHAHTKNKATLMEI